MPPPLLPPPLLILLLLLLPPPPPLLLVCDFAALGCDALKVFAHSSTMAPFA